MQEWFIGHWPRVWSPARRAEAARTSCAGGFSERPSPGIPPQAYRALWTRSRRHTPRQATCEHPRASAFRFFLRDTFAIGRYGWASRG